MALSACGPGVDVSESASPVGAREHNITFATGTDWRTFTIDPGERLDDEDVALGPAESVCLQPGYPPTCPAGAVMYDSFWQSWTADLAPILGAQWIWATGVGPSTAPAGMAHFYFSRSVLVAGRPNSGWLAIASDDYTVVHVNGQEVGSVGSVTDQDAAAWANFHLTTFDISAALRPGQNVITLDSMNGPYFCPPGCTYHDNPAGVVAGGTITYGPAAFVTP
ncbi:MAG TPA: hypothetical protein VFA20_28335 [Myxococcaceae bacterium]|nr:hypothetical protein [Myxococcaceae bacterium]